MIGFPKLAETDPEEAGSATVLSQRSVDGLPGVPLYRRTMIDVTGP
jgi:hypothetical protein